MPWIENEVGHGYSSDCTRPIGLGLHWLTTALVRMGTPGRQREDCSGRRGLSPALPRDAAAIGKPIVSVTPAEL